MRLLGEKRHMMAFCPIFSCLVRLMFFTYLEHDLHHYLCFQCIALLSSISGCMSDKILCISAALFLSPVLCSVTVVYDIFALVSCSMSSVFQRFVFKFGSNAYFHKLNFDIRVCPLMLIGKKNNLPDSCFQGLVLNSLIKKHDHVCH